MLTHDHACRAQQMAVNTDLDDTEGCDCALIAAVRVEEHVRLKAEGWVAPEAHEAEVAVAKARATMSAMTELFEQVMEMKPYEDGRISKGLVLDLIEKMGIYPR